MLRLFISKRSNATRARRLMPRTSSDAQSRLPNAKAFGRSGLLMRFGRDRKAAAAVEFAMIAAPLVLMLCASVELGMVFLVDVTLDNAVQAASRGIRTGTTTAGNTTQAQFITDICNNMGWLASSCPTSLSVEVNTYASFTAVATTAATTPISNGKLNTPLTYTIGSGSTIQMVRAYYDWPLFTPLLSPGLSTLGNGDALLSSQAIFRNEPF